MYKTMPNGGSSVWSNEIDAVLINDYPIKFDMRINRLGMIIRHRFRINRAETGKTHLIVQGSVFKEMDGRD